MATRAKAAAPAAQKTAPLESRRKTAHGVAAQAHIEAVLGSTGSGKSSYVKALPEVGRASRLLVFDPDAEWGAHGALEGTVGAVLERVKAAGPTGPFRIVFVPSPDPATAVRQFDTLCRIAFHAERVVFIVDELKSVTTPSRSPVGWGMLTGRGRKRGIRIYGISQRPASIDKDFLGNCTKVRTGRLIYDDDAKAVAKCLRVTPDEVMDLPDLAWIQRDMQTGKVTKGGQT